MFDSKTRRIHNNCRFQNVSSENLTAPGEFAISDAHDYCTHFLDIDARDLPPSGKRWIWHPGT